MNKYTIETFIKEIGLSDEAQIALSDYTLYEDEKSLKELFYRDFSAFTTKIERREDKYLAFLYLYCSLAVDVHGEYEKRGYSDEIYIDTFRDFSVWCDVCLTETGKVGLKEVEWLREPICLKIFKLGALQYQPETLEENYFLPNGRVLAKGTTIYHLHIRKGVKFTPDEVDKSLSFAKKFFNAEQMVCFCESWFLSPKLKEVLREESNIIRYQNRFELIETDMTSHSCERYIFGKYERRFENYRSTNRLSEYVLSLLRKGEAIGEATGFFIC